MLFFDIPWLLLMGKPFYQFYLGHLMAKNFNYYYVIFFYILYAIVAFFLCVKPALEKNNIYYSILHGALLGAASYMAYNGTNGATLLKWPLIVSIVDTTWGIFMTASSCGISFLLIKKYFLK